MTEVIIKYISTKNSEETIELNGLLLHSKYDPIKEAKRIVEKEYQENFVHILFGYGAGYIADALEEKLNGKENIIIVEPFLEELKINKDYVIDANDTKTVATILSQKLENYSREVKVICSPNYDKLAMEEYKKILQLVKDIQRDKQVDENTVRFGSESWQENYIKNLVCAYEDLSLNQLEKKYDCPVVIASGGPSLTKQLPLLKKVKENIILIAAGSTINSLLKNDIVPDYVVSIDGDIANYNHFKDLKLKKTALLYGMSSHYQIQQEYVGKRYALLTTNDFRVGEHMKEKYNIDLPYMPGGGSVAHFAFTIAMFITSGPIALIGQDLAYTNNATHAGDNKQFKIIDQNYLKSRDAFEVEGYLQGKVTTDYVFYSMKQAFEYLHEVIEHDSPIYNCTEGGVKLQGFKQITFNKFIETYIQELKARFINKESQKKLQFLLLIEQLHKEELIYNKIEKNLQDALSLLKLNKQYGYFKQNVLVKLDKIDQKTKEYFRDVMMDRIVEPLTIDVLRNYKANSNESVEESFVRVYNQNIELYTRLLEVTQKSKQFTKEAIEYAKIYEVDNNE